MLVFLLVQESGFWLVKEFGFVSHPMYYCEVKRLVFQILVFAVLLLIQSLLLQQMEDMSLLWRTFLTSSDNDELDKQFDKKLIRVQTQRIRHKF